MDFKKTVNTFWSLKNQETISCLSCMLMVVGLFFGRALLSIGMIVFFLNSLHPDKLAANWQQFRNNRYAVLCTLLLAIYLATGLWSDDKENWWSEVQIKLPFIFLPFAMLDAPFQQQGYLKRIILTLLLCTFGGMLYGFLSLTFASHASGDHIKSPLEGDYIRFTIAIVLTVLSVIYLSRNRLRFNLGKAAQGLLLLWSLVAVLYIHVQASKTGLLSFYILVAFFILHALIRQKRGLLVVAGMVLAGVAGSYFFSKLPSVQKQIQGFKFEQKVWQTRDTAGYNKSFSFVPRLISYELAGKVIAEHPIGGVGTGDVMAVIDTTYALRYPNIRREGRILPHNQFMCTALAAGIPTSIFLLMLVWVPMFTKRNRNIFGITTFVILFMGMMIEPMLEVQYGVFVYLFFTLLWERIASYSHLQTGVSKS